MRNRPRVSGSRRTAIKVRSYHYKSTTIAGTTKKSLLFIIRPSTHIIICLPQYRFTSHQATKPFFPFPLSSPLLSRRARTIIPLTGTHSVTSQHKDPANHAISPTWLLRAAYLVPLSLLSSFLLKPAHPLDPPSKHTSCNSVHLSFQPLRPWSTRNNSN